MHLVLLQQVLGQIVASTLATAAEFLAMDSAGNEFTCSRSVLDKDGNIFEVPGDVLDKDSNPFTVV